MLVAVLCLWALASADADDRVVTLNGRDTGRVFEGLGALSAGASSRLLIDYPEPWRSEVLDLLFKPNYGASLQHLKVEVGGDVNSTDGTEPSIARTAEEFLNPKPEYFKRGYEWWLMKEAKRRNPKIILDCLPWGAPGWIGPGKFYSPDMAEYTVKFLQGAKRAYGLDINYCGVWNETPYDTEWIKLLRRTLDAHGLQRVQIVGADQCQNQWGIAAQMQKDPKLMEAVAVIGEHYPAFHTTTEAQRTGKRLWSSEDGPWRGDWDGACALAKIYNRNYMLGRMTKTTIWSLISSYYENLPLPNSGPMKANTPWSGHYEVQPALWAIAHTTQFAQPGWQYLDGSCVPLDNGSVVALASPDRYDFSVIIESVGARQPQTVRFQVAGGLPAKPLHVWRSDAKQQFVHTSTLTPANKAFEVTVDAGCIYSLTTTTGQRKGGLASIPAAKPFPMPYEDGFDSAKPGTMPRYFSDQGGIFEVVRRADGKGNCVRQFVSVRGIDWLGHPTPEPYTMMGSTKWRDYEVSCDVRVERAGYAAVFGRITKSLQSLEPPLGYWLKASTDGTWELKAHTNALATGKVTFESGGWHTLRLRFAGDKVTALIDGAEVRTLEDDAYRDGMAGLGTGWNTAEFDNFSVRPLPAAAAPPNLAEGKPATSLPDALLNPKLQAPIKTWDEAIPLGNGLLGGLVWGEDQIIRVSLDRGDLWDERPSKHWVEIHDRFNWATMQRLVAEDRMGEFNDIFDSNYDYNGPPTKLPAGRLEITLDPSQSVEAFELSLATAEAIARLKGGSEIRAFISAAQVREPVAVLRIPGPALKDLRLRPPDSVKKLHYPSAQPGQTGNLRWFEQEGVGFAYAVCAGWKRVGDATLVAVTVATSAEGKSPLAVAQTRVQAALKAGYDKLAAPHAAWWAGFWKRSSLAVPELRILRQYCLARYLYGAASRRGAPPMPLQGVWSADEGSLPPWKGDYHNDLNTQMTYLAYRTSGDFDEGACFLDYLWNLLPAFHKFAREFYDAPGAAVPGVMSLAGQPLGGWGQYSLSPTMGAWNAHLFYLHWRHTGDRVFLQDRAYPFCREIGICLRALLKPGADGRLRLPLSSSPEIFDNTRRAFLKPNSNYDLASMKMLFLALAEMAAATGDVKASADWAATAKQLGGFHTNPDGALLLDEITPLPGSHRHLSNIIALYPFNLITTDGSSREQQIIAASLADWDQAGTRAWCGYSFSWMACLRARVGDAEAALRNLDIFVRAFTLRNGFHANGDQTGSGFSGFTYRPVTLEGNFLAMEAIHEMLLQSWSAEPGSGSVGVIRLFPATPWRWHDASFENLRAEGGHKVSARRQNNVTTWFRIVAGRDGLIRVRDNFGGRVPGWNCQGVRKVEGNFEIKAKAGRSIEATLPGLDEIPAPPADLAAPVEIKRQAQ